MPTAAGLSRVAFRLGFAIVLPACDVSFEPSCAVEVSPRGQPAVKQTPAEKETPAEREVEKPAPAPGCPGPARSGNTGCFPSTCGAGQYCDDATHGCRPGCVTDDNCGPRDICMRGGEASTGRCEACSGFDFAPAASACVVPERAGTTPCFPGECPVGQYCAGGFMSHCEPGCVSDDNCGPAERCDRAPSAVVGTCRSCYAATPTAP